MTVLEATIALAIVGLVLALAFPLYTRAVRDRRVVRVAEDLAGLLRFAQQKAVAESGSGSCVQLITTPSRAEVRLIPQCTGVGETLVRVSDPFPPDVAVEQQTVVFTGAGRLQQGSPTSILVTSADRTRRVEVHPVTGRVQIVSP
ncbi:MAG: GspH/FimT family pseudopilin [Armatimonadota bacterium]|nr:GspH/FimT family pseudopilin [Armatimonadota bacterium]